MDFGVVGFLSPQEFEFNSYARRYLPYMAPELRQDWSNLLPHSDFYSLGAMLYEILVGRVPAPQLAPSQRAQPRIRDRGGRDHPQGHGRPPPGSLRHRGSLQAGGDFAAGHLAQRHPQDVAPAAALPGGGRLGRIRLGRSPTSRRTIPTNPSTNPAPGACAHARHAPCPRIAPDAAGCGGEPSRTPAESGRATAIFPPERGGGGERTLVLLRRLGRSQSRKRMPSAGSPIAAARWRRPKRTRRARPALDTHGDGRGKSRSGPAGKDPGRG